MSAIQKVSPIQEAVLSEEQVDLIKRTVAKGATNDELALFLYQCKRTGLDPLLKQIHAVKRWDRDAGREVMSIQTGIDGYRLVATRTGKLAGIDDAVFDKEDGEHPGKASVTVYKLDEHGQARSYTASARWAEYVQKKKDGTITSFWARMPYGQLGKCAEALALRKAFPNDLSGVYTFEEMAQASEDGDAIQAERGPKCEECKRDVTGYTKPGGEVVAMSKVLSSGREKWSLDLCAGCQIGRARKEKETIEEPKKAEPKKLAPVAVSTADDCEILSTDEGEHYARGTVTQIFHQKGTGKPFSFRIGKLIFTCWHRNTLVPALIESMNKIVEVAFTLKDDYRTVDRIITIDGKAFAGELEIQEHETLA